MHEQLIQNLQNGIDKIQVDLNRHEAVVADLRQSLLRNEGALMLAMNLQKEAKDAEEKESARLTEDEAAPPKPVRSVETVAAERKSKKDEEVAA